VVVVVWPWLFGLALVLVWPLLPWVEVVFVVEVCAPATT
jgi:hypothetical protein